MGLLRLIAIACIVYYLWRILSRVVFPLVSRAFSRDKGGGGRKRPGVSVHYDPKQYRREEKKVGQYVDYEEIDNHN